MNKNTEEEKYKKRGSNLAKYVAGAVVGSAALLFSGCNGSYSEGSGIYYDDSRDLRYPWYDMDARTFHFWLRGQQVPPHPYPYFRGRPSIPPRYSRPYAPSHESPKTQPYPQRPIGPRPSPPSIQKPSNSMPQSPRVQPPGQQKPYTPRTQPPGQQRPRTPKENTREKK